MTKIIIEKITFESLVTIFIPDGNIQAIQRLAGGRAGRRIEVVLRNADDNVVKEIMHDLQESGYKAIYTEFSPRPF